MDARIQRLVEEGQRILLKIAAAQEDLSVPASQIRGWERDAVANFDRLTELSKGYPFPDPELGEASGRAAIGMATLMALLSRAPGGAIPRDEARRRLAELKRQYGICEKYAPYAQPQNQAAIVIDYSQRINQLEIFENNLEKFYSTNVVQAANSAKGGCYVATAVYGSYDCPQVWTLRRFRDQKLSVSAAGRSFIRVYYAVSPRLVRVVGHRRGFAALVRPALDMIVLGLQRRGYESSSYLDSTSPSTDSVTPD